LPEAGCIPLLPRPALILGGELRIRELLVSVDQLLPGLGGSLETVTADMKVVDAGGGESEDLMLPALCYEVDADVSTGDVEIGST
jgi:hypothetical protein